MIIAALRLLAQALLRLRYRIRVLGREQIAVPGRSGILFLPTHPALIDPVILTTELHRLFRPRILADKDQVDRPVIRWLAAGFGVRPIPEASRYGEACRPELERILAACIEDLRSGANLMLYPAGHILRQRLEELGGNSAVEMILKAVPEVRIVLIRTRGLWGSSFSRAQGRPPALDRALLHGLRALLANGLFFSPRRAVTIEFHEPTDFPRAADRNAINRYLENYDNDNAPANTYVPYTIWEKGGPHVLPEPKRQRPEGDLNAVPAATRELVRKHLAQVTGQSVIPDDALLSKDLGMDSLAGLDLAMWLEAEFGFNIDDPGALVTVADAILCAAGTVLTSSAPELKPIPAAWFAKTETPETLTIPAGDTIPEVFLRQARRHPQRLIIADQTSGAKSYRDLLAAICALKPEIENLPGAYVGIMLPASVAATVAILTVLFAGKTPVMINWTVGARNMKHALDLLGVQRVLTAARLLQKIESQGTGLEGIKDRCLLLEELGQRITLPRKLGAWLQSRWGGASLASARPPATAVVLFTSGSESLPKAVPLTHGNLLANIRDIAAVFPFHAHDRVLGMLPPFHSFGVNCTTLLPLCAGVPVVYHANPTEGGTLARLIEAYRASLLIGTPTFLNGIIRAASDRQLATLRCVISGAEKCPSQTYEVIARRWPRMLVLEGYGITECSPGVSFNDARQPRPGTIGKVLPSVKYALQDPETGQRAAPGQQGLLLLQGPSIFGGYLNYEGASPFVAFEGQQWYRTGDLVREDADGALTFAGRLKRFVKLGGEMISLPAIEEALARRYTPADADEPVLAVVSAAQELNPELVLFTTQALEREEINRKIREAGLSPLHNIRQVRTIDKLPLLGTGKTDYRALQDLLKSGG